MYFATLGCLFAVFIFYQCRQKPEMLEGRQMEMMNRGMDGPGMNHDGQMNGPVPPEFRNQDNGQMEPGGNKSDKHGKPDNGPFGMKGKFRKDRKFTPPVFIGEKDLVSSIVMVLLVGMNLGVKLYFRAEKKDEEMKELEKQNLTTQLEYLKYQINPHFFMNTLNNIHALVDIDPEKAKTTIVELSKMMRYLLYEGSKQLVPLQKEQQFVESYISLMKLRYTDMVDIINDVPDQLPNMMIPPLLTINFIENAFKHGVSYKQKSFIHIELRVIANRLYFSCQNSKHQESTKEQGGVGIVNTRKRLDLIFGENYSLEINNKNDNYEVKLDIPLTKASNTEDQKEDA
jgi:hypothetical protein